jgi:hypothetical protein
MFTMLLLSNSRFFLFHYFGFQLSPQYYLATNTQVAQTVFPIEVF